jgi:central kinetochore subunit Mis15/CHL4
VQSDGNAPAQPANRTRRGRPSLLERTAEDMETIESGDGWVPNVRVAFTGTHVFAGIRQLVEEGIVDGERMPGWMTGEAGVTVGAVRDGRIKAKDKDGIPGV